MSRLFLSVFGDVYRALSVSKIAPEHDFTRLWFLNNSGKIMLIALLSFNFSSLIDILYSVFRKAAITHIAAQQPTVAEMNDYLKCETVQIQFIYAFALNIIFFTLLFGVVMPLLWVFGFVSVLLLYWVQKLIFLRYCQQPVVYGHSINHLVTRFILIGIALSTGMAPLLLGAAIEPTSSIG
jgi:hypothetical protein